MCRAADPACLCWEAEAVHYGASKVEGVSAEIYAVDSGEAPWADIEKADAIIFGAPTYMGGPSAQFKTFQDATSRTVFAAGGKWKDKLAAGFTNSASLGARVAATALQFVRGRA